MCCHLALVEGGIQLALERLLNLGGRHGVLRPLLARLASALALMALDTALPSLAGDWMLMKVWSGDLTL